MKSIVVTGVSTGVGWAATKALLRDGFRVFGSVRKVQDAERLSRDFGENFVQWLFDVTDEPAVRAAARQVREHLHGETLFALVNNAGIAVPGPFMLQTTDDVRHQLEVNRVSVLIVTKAFLPLLGASRSSQGSPGRIVNVGSASGRFGSPFVGAYVTSKYGLEGFSESLRRELMLYGIDVIVVAPGPTATPIWDKAERVDLSEYANTDYAEPGHPEPAGASGRTEAPRRSSDCTEVRIASVDAAVARFLQLGAPPTASTRARSHGASRDNRHRARNHFCQFRPIIHSKPAMRADA